MMSLPPNDGTGIYPAAPAPEPEEPTTPEPEEPEPEFDPSAHTVAEVQAYLAEHPDQTDYVLDRERAGKARTTLIGD